MVISALCSTVYSSVISNQCKALTCEMVLGYTQQVLDSPLDCTTCKCVKHNQRQGGTLFYFETLSLKHAPIQMGLNVHGALE